MWNWTAAQWQTAVTYPATIPLSPPAVAISETINSEQSTDNREQTTDNGLRLTDNLLSLSIGGSYWRADDPGDTATFSFTGPWLNLGFIGSNFVQLDYIDVWDGSTLPDGLFEHTDNRVILSAGWFTITHAAASGGSYIRDNVGTVWFPFSGDSFTFHTIAQNNNGSLTLYVDGQYLITLHNYNPDLVAQTYSFEGFGPGPHLLQVNPYGGFHQQRCQRQRPGQRDVCGHQPGSCGGGG